MWLKITDPDFAFNSIMSDQSKVSTFTVVSKLSLPLRPFVVQICF